MSFDATRRITGPTMGASFSVTFSGHTDVTALHHALQRKTDTIDAMMSNWKPTSDIMRFNAQPVGAWTTLPDPLIDVLQIAMTIHHASHRAFDPNVDDLSHAWGFRASHVPDAAQIKQTLGAPVLPYGQAIEIDPDRKQVRKIAPAQIDLSGIAKGYGVDQLMNVVVEFGLDNALVEINGDMRAMGPGPRGIGWQVGVECATDGARDIEGVLTLTDISVASSGRYRQYHTVNGRHMSHTMNPKTRLPVQTGPEAVSVLHPSCAHADAWATVFMVLDVDTGRSLAKTCGLDVIYPQRHIVPRHEHAHT